MGNTFGINTQYAHYPKNYACPQLEERSYSDLNSLGHCIDSIKGQDSNSESATDIYILKKDNDTLFMKLFITGIDLTQISSGNLSGFEKEVYPLIYEYGVYLGKINRLVKYNICPFFVTTKGGSLRNKKYEIINFLNGRLKDNTGANVPNVKINDNFDRNIKILLQLISGGPKIPRPSISNNTIVGFNNIINSVNITENFNFGYFITHGFNDSKTSTQILVSPSEPTDIFNNLDEIDNKVPPQPSSEITRIYNNLEQLYIIFTFELAIAFKSMELSKIVNCDLHTGNILFNEHIQYNNINDTSNRLSSQDNNITFFIEDKKYHINLPFLIKIYDFDRSYVYGNKGNQVNAPLSEIKNTTFSVAPTYNKNNIRDFLLPISMYINNRLYTLLRNNVNSNGNIINNDRHNNISKIINSITESFMEKIDDIPIYISNIQNPSNPPSLLQYSQLLKIQVHGDPTTGIQPNNIYINLSEKSKKFIRFIIEINNHFPSDGWVRNIRLHDNTFITNIFYNFDKIIKNLYDKINPIFKPTCNNNDCVLDIDSTKYYMHTSIFDQHGALNKKGYYQYINYVYTHDTINKIAALNKQSRLHNLQVASVNQNNDLMDIG